MRVRISVPGGPRARGSSAAGPRPEGCPAPPHTSSRAPAHRQIPARASDRNSGEDRRVSDTPRRMGDTPRSLGAGGGGYRPDSSYSQPRDRASESDDRRGRTGMPVPSLGLGASSKTSPRISKVPCAWVGACGLCVRWPRCPRVKLRSGSFRGAVPAARRDWHACSCSSVFGHSMCV